jgi:hypothetical protein
MSLGIAAAVVGGTALVGSIYSADKAASASKAGARAAERSAQLQAEIANREIDLAEKQYTDQQALLAEYSPLLKDLIGKSVTAQDKATQQSDSAWADYTATWRPVEQKLAADSLAYASPGRQAQEAQRAASGVAQTFDQARADTRQALQSAGADATTIASLEAAGRLEEAKAKAGASDNARRDVEKAGLAYVDNAARFGRNMTSTGIATAQLAGASGGQAQGGYGALSAATAQPAAQAGALYGQAAKTAGASGYMSLAAADARSNAYQQQGAVFGDLMGSAAQIYGMFGTSSEKTKKVGKKVDGRKASDAVERTPSKEWSYKPGLGDGNTKPRMGPMAEGLREATGGVVSDGKMVDFIAMSGLHHAAIGDNSKRLRRIEKQLGLADAEV